jgi:peptidoglycan/LPS O-acetylase OafA/YrhL
MQLLSQNESLSGVAKEENIQASSLNILRIIAFAAVFFGHSFSIFFRYGEYNNLNLKSSYLHPTPWSGVWIFFFISGYLMALTFLHKYGFSSKDIAAFYLARFKRLAPLYYLISLIVFAGKIILEGNHKSIEYLIGLTKIIFFNVQAGDLIMPIGAAWTITTEVYFYILFPAIFMLVLHVFSRSEVKAFIILTIFCFVEFAMRFYFLKTSPEFWPTFIYPSLLFNLDIFIAGIIAGIWFSPKIKSKLSKIIRIRNSNLFTIFIILFSIIIIYLKMSRFYVANDLLGGNMFDIFVYGPSCTIIIMLFTSACFNCYDFLRYIDSKCKYLAILTYPSYLIQEPIGLLMGKYITCSNFKSSFVSSIFLLSIVISVSVCLLRLEKMINKQISMRWS